MRALTRNRSLRNAYHLLPQLMLDDRRQQARTLIRQGANRDGADTLRCRVPGVLLATGAFHQCRRLFIANKLLFLRIPFHFSAVDATLLAGSPVASRPSWLDGLHNN